LRACSSPTSSLSERRASPAKGTWRCGLERQRRASTITSVREIDPDGEHFTADQIVKVYRPEDEVFAQDSVHSFLLKPITDDHPKDPVNAANWQNLAKGVNAGALRDGEYLAFDLVLMDKALIDAVGNGKRELSNGYSSEIEFGDGVAPDGQPFQATQRAIRGNHIAVVDKGRAGSECRIGDAAHCDAAPQIAFDGQTYTRDASGDIVSTQRSDASSSQTGSGRQDGEAGMATKTINFDGLPVEVTDAAEAVIRKLEGQVKTLTDAKAQSDTKVGELTATVSTKDGEIAALNKKIEDSVLTPAQLEKMVADRSVLIGQAKGIDAKIVTDGLTEAQIRKAAVVSQFGDAASWMDDAAIGGAFAVLAKDVKVDPVRDAITATPVVVGDAAAEYAASKEKAKAALRDGWRTPAIAA
jgi:hypothetical protein